MEVSLVWC